MTGAPAAEIERVFREEYGRAVAILIRLCGDIGVAEEAVQDAFTAAVERWPSTGLPPSPAGWIIATARNRAIDRFRREASREPLHLDPVRLDNRLEERSSVEATWAGLAVDESCPRAISGQREPLAGSAREGEELGGERVGPRLRLRDRSRGVDTVVAEEALLPHRHLGLDARTGRRLP